MSKHLCRPGFAKGISQTRKQIFPGPLGVRNLLTENSGQNKLSSNQIKVDHVALYTEENFQANPKMSDINFVELVSHILNDSITLSVIVFSNADTLIEAYFEQATFKEFHNRLRIWAKTNTQSIKFVFIFRQPTSIQKLIDKFSKNGLSILSSTSSSDQLANAKIIQVNAPEKEELQRLVHYHRLVNKIAIDLNQVEELLKMAATERKKLQYWHTNLENSKNFNQDTVETWLSA